MECYNFQSFAGASHKNYILSQQTLHFIVLFNYYVNVVHYNSPTSKHAINLALPLLSIDTHTEHLLSIDNEQLPLVASQPVANILVELLSLPNSTFFKLFEQKKGVTDHR